MLVNAQVQKIGSRQGFSGRKHLRALNALFGFFPRLSSAIHQESVWPFVFRKENNPNDPLPQESVWPFVFRKENNPNDPLPHESVWPFVFREENNPNNSKVVGSAPQCVCC